MLPMLPLKNGEPSFPCQILLGAHGANMANMIFAPDGMKVVEIVPQARGWHGFNLYLGRRIYPGKPHCTRFLSRCKTTTSGTSLQP